jgi:hypothetical protein
LSLVEAVEQELSNPTAVAVEAVAFYQVQDNQ